ncbi:hypothetical protein BHV26_08380 [Campylobacter coli]|nr:hypothetical protein [Campylobacter coli]
MLLSFFIYLAGVFGALKIIAVVALFILFVTFCFSFVFNVVAHVGRKDHLRKMTSKSIKICVITSIIFGAIIILVPRSSTMYLMAGAYVGTEAIENPNIVNKLSKVNKIIDYKLDEMLKELESKKLDSNISSFKDFKSKYLDSKD